jgi:hypothetical protein
MNINPALIRAGKGLYEAPEPGRHMPSTKELDAAAGFKLTGGFKTRPSNICPACFTARSINGTCSC